MLLLCCVRGAMLSAGKARVGAGQHQHHSSCGQVVVESGREKLSSLPADRRDSGTSINNANEYYGKWLRV